MGRVIDPLVSDESSGDPEFDASSDGERRVPSDEAPLKTSSAAATVSPDSSVEAGRSEDEPSTSSQPPEAAAEPGSARTPRTGHPVRDRLLARAAEARNARVGAVGETGGLTEARNARVGSIGETGGLTEPRNARVGSIGETAGLAEFETTPAGPTSPLDQELDRIAADVPRGGTPLLIQRGQHQLSPNLVAVFGTLLGLLSVASIVAVMMRVAPRDQLAVVAAPPEAVASAPATAPTPSAAPPPAPRRERQRVEGPWRVRDDKDKPGVRVIEGEIGLLPFLRALTEKGLATKEAYRAHTALKPLRNLDKCDRSDRFVALVERGTGKLQAFEYVVSPEEIYQAKTGDDGLLKAKKLDLAVKRAQVSGAIQVDGPDLSAAIQRGGLEPALTRALDTALDGHLDLEELKRGDRLRVVAQEVTVLGEFSRYAGIEAVEVTTSDEEKPLRVYYFRGSKSRGYYDHRGRAPYEGGWRKPVKDAPVTSKYNPKRLHPVVKKIMPHTGTDFGAPTGTPVGASSFGTVSFIGYAGPSGNLVKVEHPGGIETGYAHLSRFAEGLKVGDKVTRLQVIGYVGSTGRSTGPHLHFTAKRNGEFFDAETLNLDAMRVLPSEERSEFDQMRAKYDALLDAIPLPAPLVVAAKAPSAEAPPPGAEPPGEDEADGPETVPAAAPAPQPAAPAPAPQPAAPRGPSVYLTNEDLLKAQSATDDGEVEE